MQVFLVFLYRRAATPVTARQLHSIGVQPPEYVRYGLHDVANQAILLGQVQPEDDEGCRRIVRCHAGNNGRCNTCVPDIIH